MSIFSKESEAQRKRRISNNIGFFAFIVVLTFIVISLLMRSSHEKTLQKETKKTMADLANGFSKNNRELISLWASGNVVDSWGHQIVIDYDDGSEIKLSSKGPDGLLGTSDDISHVQKRNKSKNNQEIDLKGNLKKPVDKNEDSSEKTKKEEKSFTWKWISRFIRSAEDNN